MLVEGVLTALFGGPLMGYLTESYGYKLDRGGEKVEAGAAAMDSAADTKDSNALATSLIGLGMVSWGACAFFWAVMYLTLPGDRRAALAEKAREDAEIKRRNLKFGNGNDAGGNNGDADNNGNTKSTSNTDSGSPVGREHMSIEMEVQDGSNEQRGKHRSEGLHRKSPGYHSSLSPGAAGSGGVANAWKQKEGQKPQRAVPSMLE
jgi:hypothetical protein